MSGREVEEPMTQPVGGYSRNLYAFTQNDEPATNAGLEFCRNATTVTEGFLCDEPTVVSNACRSPKIAGEAFVCDDKKMASLQHEIWDTVKSLVMTAVGVLAGGDDRP
jgi:hypothetical protein